MSQRSVIILALSLLAAAVWAPAALGAGLADSPWPMYQGGVAHAGRSGYSGPSDPAVKWSLHLDGMPGSPVIGPDGTIYLPTGMLNQDETGSLYAIRPDGTVKWRFSFAGLPSNTAPAIAADGTIYVHMNGNEGNIAAPEKLYAVNPDGTLQWTFLPSGDAASYCSSQQSSPAIGSDGTIYFGSMNTLFYALHPDGTVRWAASPSVSSIVSSPAIGPDGTVYVQDCAATLAAYTPTGATRWILQADQITGGQGSPTVSADGTVYLVTSGSSLLKAISPAGVVEWSAAAGSMCVATPALAADGTIYVDDDGVYAFRPDGTMRWHSIGDTLFSSQPPVVGADGTIYWREGWDLFALSATGTTLWHRALSGSGAGGLDDPAPAIGADGTLYVPEPNVLDPGDQYLRAYADTSPSACVVTLRLAGLRAGALRLGGRVTASGIVTAERLGAANATLEVERRVRGAWVAVKSASRPLAEDGSFVWRYKPAARGSYRMQARVAATAANLAGASAWRSFRVR